MPPQVIHGDDLLYRFFRDLLDAEPELAARVPQLMVRTMAVWLPLDLYETFPVLLPWVVRDPTCRSARATKMRPARPDQWGSPNEAGYLRDDNSLVKGLVKHLEVEGPPGTALRGRRLGNQFVASHIWREVRGDVLASRLPLLNTFVPNLVWLPKQVAKLSDLEGRDVQRALKSLSWAIYRNAPVAPHLADVVAEAWAALPEPAALDDALVVEQMNWFLASARFRSTRRARLREVLAALDLLEEGQALPARVVCSRYAIGLPAVPSEARAELRRWLLRFRAE